MAHAPEDWLSAARAGSQEALGQALEACRRYLLQIAQQELDPALQAKGGASDVVQETFLEAQRDFDHFHGGSEAELRAWLRQLLLHHLYKLARRFRTTQKRAAGREVSLEAAEQTNGVPVASGASPSVQAMAHEQATVIGHALARLPEDYRQVIVWRYQEHRSFEEIAGRMNRSETAVRKLWARALERLQAEMRRPP
ncbi:MAG: sigma-70 family RNA polymerase sigma factor [Gemmataceae bacterium]|nr:sigma-70 family RNA polymerase sigma factor [Gemmataceae bacterium]